MTLSQCRRDKFPVCRRIYVGLLFCMVGLTKETLIERTEGCTIEGVTLVCKHSLPRILPRHISDVIVEDFLLGRIQTDTFNSSSWRRVISLDITVNINVNFRLHDNNFLPLKNLTRLGIHSPNMVLDGGNYILRGLIKLQSLNLSSCYHLQTTDLHRMLQSDITLQALILDQCCMYEGRKLVADTSFYTILNNTRVHTLSLSGCNVHLQGPLDLTSFTFELNDLDRSNTTITVSKVNSSLIASQFIDKISDTLKRLDISYREGRFWDVDSTMWTGCTHFPKLEVLKMNHYFSIPIVINNSRLDMSKCHIGLKYMQYRSNHFVYFNLTLIWPKDNQLTEVDHSSNGMKYLSPLVYRTACSLEVFLLAHNKLNFMSSFVEFKDLFTSFHKLRHVDLSDNKLTWIPYSMFSNNSQLTVLDLSDNELMSIRFELRHMYRLRHLNLRKNKILYISASYVNQLAFLTRNVSTQIDLLDNPFLCNCQSAQFLVWLSSLANSNYSCTLDGTRVPVDRKTIKETQFSCIRSKVIMTSVSASCAFLLIVSIATACIIYRKRLKRQKRTRANFIDDFKDGVLDQNFLCYLSFSSEDEGEYVNEIQRRLEESLRAITELDQGLICMGDLYFRPGLPIVDEILRCVSKSCVGVFIVTDKFCESHWCQMEVREAYELSKPIILICKDTIDLDIMPVLLRNIFNNFTRAKLMVNGNRLVELRPGFDYLANSILKLSVAQYENGVQLRR